MQAMWNFMLHFNKSFFGTQDFVFCFRTTAAILFRESAFLYHDVS